MVFNIFILLIEVFLKPEFSIAYNLLISIKNLLLKKHVFTFFIYEYLKMYTMQHGFDVTPHPDLEHLHASDRDVGTAPPQFRACLDHTNTRSTTGLRGYFSGDRWRDGSDWIGI
jgi:hypothetical protein